MMDSTQIVDDLSPRWEQLLQKYSIRQHNSRIEKFDNMVSFGIAFDIQEQDLRDQDGNPELGWGTPEWGTGDLPTKQVFDNFTNDVENIFGDYVKQYGLEGNGDHEGDGSFIAYDFYIDIFPKNEPDLGVAQGTQV